MNTFERAANHYAQAAILQRQAADALWQLGTTTTKLTPGTSWLDLGCGTGWLTNSLLATNLQVTALDQAPTMLAHLPQHAALTRLCTDMTQVQFPPRSFTGIVSNFALHWTTPSLIEAVADWLMPRGQLWLSLPVAGSLNAFQTRYPQLPCWKFIDWREWQTAITQAGLQIQMEQRHIYQLVQPNLRVWLQQLRQAGGAGVVTQAGSVGKLKRALDEDQRNPQPLALDYHVWQVIAVR